MNPYTAPRASMRSMDGQSERLISADGNWKLILQQQPPAS